MVMATHLCHGKFFARPFESLDAVWRRLLTANPGVTGSQLRNHLLAEINSRPGLEHALLAHCRNPRLPRLSREYHVSRRQCPKCARGLYHCTLFNLPWLVLCPIHGTCLTDICPDCSRPWPRPREMANRGCSTCGCPCVSDLADYASEAAPESAFQILGDLDARIAAVENHGMDLVTTARSANVTWHRYRPTDAIYGDLLIGLNTHAPLCRSSQPPQGLSVRVFRCRAGRRLDYPHDEKCTSGVRHFLKRRQVLRHWAHTLAIKTIVQAVDRHTSDGHGLLLGDYSLLGLAEFQSLPPPCPYCLAFSLWMDHVVHSLAPAGLGLNEDRYPFLWELQAPLTSSLTPYLVCSDAQGVCDLPDAAFVRVYYRALLLVFRGLLIFSKRLQFVRQNSDGPKWVHSPPESQIGWGYYLSRQYETLTLALVREHPLLGVNEEWPDVTGKECRAFHRQLTGPRHPWAGVAIGPSPGIPRSSFARLIRHFLTQHPNLLPTESQDWMEMGLRRY